MIHLVVAASTAVHLLKRRCPRCHREQVVPASRARRVVGCLFCRAPVPPPR